MPSLPRIPLDLDIANSDYSSILAAIMAFLGMEDKESVAPPLYLLPSHRHQTALVLSWLQARAGTATPLPLYSLPTLLFHLARVGSEVGTEVPTEILAEVQLDRDVFLYTAGMACRSLGQPSLGGSLG